MDGYELKSKLQSGGVVYGTMLSAARNPRWAETIGGFGLDYAIIDTEHSPRSRDEVADFLTAFRYSGVVPIVRVPIPDAHYVTMYMDAGAQGVLAPYCETVDEVKEVVGAAKWRPLKGALLREVMDSGRFPSDATKKYLSDKGKNSVCIIGIESVPAVENLENILKVDGIDGVFVGPNDLSITIGVPDQYDHPEYESALRRIISVCKSANTPVMIHHQSVALTQKWLEEGARFVLYSSDARTMHNGFVDEFGAIKASASELGNEAGDDSKEFGEVL